MLCPCQSEVTYANCCEPYIQGKKNAPTAEKLMRSRYAAYTLAEIHYIKKTLAKEAQKEFDFESSLKWAKDSKWHGLQILNVKNGLENDKNGTVEFICKYEQDGQVLEHHEVSKFKKNSDGQWVFVDGDSHTHKEGEGHHHHKVETQVREEPKIGRNDACPCGSGKKYKKCCGSSN